MWVCSVLEVHQFSRDAGVAEAWLMGQEPYLSSREIGQNVDDVEKLIKRHEAFEKSAATWEERFAALERLTTVSHMTLSLLLNWTLKLIDLTKVRQRCVLEPRGRIYLGEV